jgi:ribosomal subunit interface protein
MKIRVTFDGFESSQAISDYLGEKIGKHSSLLDDATGVEAVLRQNVHARGVKDDFKANILVTMPHNVIRVEESAEDIYKAIDIAEDTLFRVLKKHRDKHKRVARKRLGKPY